MKTNEKNLSMPWTCIFRGKYNAQAEAWLPGLTLTGMTESAGASKEQKQVASMRWSNSTHIT